MKLKGSQLSGKVDLTIDENVAHLHLNNPAKKNAISAEMWSQLQEHANEISSDHSIRVTVLQGVGTAAFAAGADISQFETKRTPSASGSTYDETTENAISAIKRIPTPVIAAIRGYCIGGGVSLALACDFRVASDDANFSVPPAKLGTAYPYLALKRLVQQIGPSNSKYLLFTGQRVDAISAMKMNLIDLIWNNEDFEKGLAALVQTIVKNAPLSIKASKYGIDQFSENESEPDLEQIFRLANQCFASSDYKEGIRAFMESREPHFRGE